MLRRASRSLFVARNRALLVQSSRALGKGATNPTVVGANKQAQPQNSDPAGQAPLEFGQHDKESSMFAQAASAWGTMRKVGQANPIETNIEKYEDRYQTEGTGAEPTQDKQASPGLWGRAKEAVQAVKDTLTPGSLKTQDASRKEDITFAGTQGEQVSTLPLEEQQRMAAELREQRPGFADDATGHRPWNWEMADDSIRNSTDGMGIIEPVGPTAADYEAKHPEWSSTQVNDNLQAQKQEFQQDLKDTKQAAKQNWQETKQAANQNWQETKQAANENWQDAKQTVKENWQETKQAAKQNISEASNTLSEKFEEKKESFNATKEVAKENLKEKKEEVQQSWDDTKEVAKEGFREAGKQLKKGFDDLKEGAKNLGQAAREATTPENAKNMSAKPDRVEESYEELYNQPPGKGFKAAAERLTEQELKDSESTTRQEVKKGQSAEHGEKNAQVPKKKPTRYGDWEHGSRASDF